MSETSVSDQSVSSHRVSDVCPSDLSARALTDDAEGCSRLRAVIASDPGYASRAQEVQSGRVKPFAPAVLTIEAVAPSGLLEVARCAEAPACEALSRQPTTTRPGPTARPARAPGGPSPVVAVASSLVALAFGSQGLAAITLRLPTS